MSFRKFNKVPINGLLVDFDPFWKVNLLLVFILELIAPLNQLNHIVLGQLVDYFDAFARIQIG